MVKSKHDRNLSFLLFFMFILFGLRRINRDHAEALFIVIYVDFTLVFSLEANHVSNIHKVKKTRKRYRRIHVNEDEMFI